MSKGPAAALNWVSTKISLVREPVDPETLLVEISLDQGWAQSLAEAQEQAERWRTPFVNRLRILMNDPDREGQPQRFEFNSLREDWIQGACHVENENSDALRASKARRIHTDVYLGLIRSLSGRQFEGVCRGMLDLVGCPNPRVTSRGNDQGIDFYGRMSMRGRLNMKYEQTAIDETMAVWIVGQAKQIKGNVSTPELRDLVGSLELAKAKISADDGKSLGGLALRPYDPVLPIFITTGSFSKDSLKLIGQTGLRGYDGMQVATMLADHEVGIQGGECDPQEFSKWIIGQLAQVA